MSLLLSLLLLPCLCHRRARPCFTCLLSELFRRVKQFLHDVNMPLRLSIGYSSAPPSPLRPFIPSPSAYPPFFLSLCVMSPRRVGGNRPQIFPTASTAERRSLHLSQPRSTSREDSRPCRSVRRGQIHDNKAAAALLRPYIRNYYSGQHGHQVSQRRLVQAAGRATARRFCRRRYIFCRCRRRCCCRFVAVVAVFLIVFATAVSVSDPRETCFIRMILRPVSVGQ